jgi:CheY-like chemotaxis protein
MSHFFDVRALPQLLDDAQRLVSQASDHERRLADLVVRLECQGGDRPPASASRSPWRNPRVPSSARSGERSGEPPSLTLTVRDLCVAARDQRQHATTLLRRVLGELAADGDTKPLPTRVLVVDDSFDTCEMASIILEAAGFHVITASNGLEGVLAAHMAKPAVVLMDITMPILNGIEAARLLKASTATRALQLIAYTAEPDFHEVPLIPLFVAVLPKPSLPDAIVTSVKRYIRRSDERHA